MMKFCSCAMSEQIPAVKQSWFWGLVTVKILYETQFCFLWLTELHRHQQSMVFMKELK